MVLVSDSWHKDWVVGSIDFYSTVDTADVGLVFFRSKMLGCSMGIPYSYSLKVVQLAHSMYSVVLFDRIHMSKERKFGPDSFDTLFLVPNFHITFDDSTPSDN